MCMWGGGGGGGSKLSPNDRHEGVTRCRQRCISYAWYDMHRGMGAGDAHATVRAKIRRSGDCTQVRYVSALGRHAVSS